MQSSNWIRRVLYTVSLTEGIQGPSVLLMSIHEVVGDVFSP